MTRTEESEHEQDSAPICELCGQYVYDLICRCRQRSWQAYADAYCLECDHQRDECICAQSSNSP